MNKYVMDYLESKMSEDGRRRRSRRTGRYMSDRMMDRRDYDDERDYDDVRMERRHDYDDERDYHYGKLELNKSDMYEWKRKLRNSDGTKGPHFEMQHIVQAADKLGVKFKEYDEREFCMTVNMLYSDYSHVVNKYIPHDKSLMFFAEMAKAFLEDEDAPEGSEKLALYYHCIVCNEEV